MDELLKSRRDIEALMLVLQEWQEAHPADDRMDVVKVLLDKLDVLHMVW